MTPIRLRVRELRDAAGLSQSELSKRAKIRRATLIDIEKGRTTGVDFTVLERLANALDVDAGYLVVHSKKGKR